MLRYACFGLVPYKFALSRWWGCFVCIACGIGIVLGVLTCVLDRFDYTDREPGIGAFATMIKLFDAGR